MSRPEYPRLDELIAAAGGYDKITPAMWADYDRRVERWNADYRAGLLGARKSRVNKTSD